MAGSGGFGEGRRAELFDALTDFMKPTYDDARSKDRANISIMNLLFRDEAPAQPIPEIENDTED